MIVIHPNDREKVLLIQINMDMIIVMVHIYDAWRLVKIEAIYASDYGYGNLNVHI